MQLILGAMMKPGPGGGAGGVEGGGLGLEQQYTLGETGDKLMNVGGGGKREHSQLAGKKGGGRSLGEVADDLAS